MIKIPFYYHFSENPLSEQSAYSFRFTLIAHLLVSEYKLKNLYILIGGNQH